MKQNGSTTALAFMMCAIGAGGCGDSAASAPARETNANTSRGYLGPAFPGAGASGAGWSIAAGLKTVTCGDTSGPGGTTGPAPGATSTMTCLYGADANVPQATMEWIVESAANAELVHVRLTLNPAFCDNSYGANAIGWNSSAAAAAAPAMMGPGGKMMPGMAGKPGKGGHTFNDLVGSDHAEFKLRDAQGALTLQFKLDYITSSSAASAGYATLGVTGGEGKMIVGQASDIVAASTSLDRNLNACGMPSYTTDSPATDANYTPNSAAPNWDYRVVYDVWVKQSAFGSVGFGSGIVDFVHASPSKADSDSVDVVPGDCPSDWPPYCNDPAGCGAPDDECSDPDSCKGGSVPDSDAGTASTDGGNCAWVEPPSCDPDIHVCDSEPVWTCSDAGS